MSELDVLRERIRKILNDVADDIIGGSCQNYPQYTHKTGVIEGLAIAERELLDLQQELERA